MASKRSSRISSARSSRASSVEVPTRTQQLRECKVDFLYKKNEMKAAKCAKAAENRLKKAHQLKRRERRRKLGFLHWTQLGPYEIWVREQIMAAVARGGMARAVQQDSKETPESSAENPVIAGTSGQESSTVQNDPEVLTQVPLTYNKELKQRDDIKEVSLDIEINYMGSPIREPIPDFPEADQIQQEKLEVPELNPILDSVNENIDPATAIANTWVKYRDLHTKKRSW